MPYMKWNSGLEVGIHDFDEHHMQLVALLNRAHDGVTHDASREDSRAIIDELFKYATYHFTAEESWMRAHEYPGLPRHREEHEQFIAKIVQFQKDDHSAKLILSIEVLNFLYNWLTNHILEKDIDYGHFAKGAVS